MKVKYIFKKIKSIRFKEFIKRAKIIAHNNHRLTIYILFDMAYCALKYGSGYMDYFEFEFYLLNKDERKTYLTGEINNRIVKKYNLKDDWYKFDDKTTFNKIFKNYLGRSYLDLRDSSFDEFKSFIKNKEKIVLKLIDDCGGKGINVVDTPKIKKDIKSLYDLAINNKQYLVEDYIIQHNDMSKLYKGSVNSLRIITFLDDFGVAHILNSVIRIGNGGNVDNFSSGGMYSFVNEDGNIFVPAIDEDGNVYNKHPISNTDIVGFKVPNYDFVKTKAIEASKVVPSIRYVGWDFAVGKDEIFLIEGNPYPGIFQVKPSISGIKCGLLKEYKKYMDI